MTQAGKHEALNSQKLCEDLIRVAITLSAVVIYVSLVLIEATRHERNQGEKRSWIMTWIIATQPSSNSIDCLV